MIYLKPSFFISLLFLFIFYKKCLCQEDIQDNWFFRENRRVYNTKQSIEHVRVHIPFWALLFLIVLFTMFFLVILGIIKGLIGLYICAPVGMWGLGMLIDLPRPLEQYQEAHLANIPVKYDDIGWPVDPDTGKRSVRALTRSLEFYLNIIFFLAYPMTMVITMCNACCFQDTPDESQCYKCVNTIVLSEFKDKTKTATKTKMEPNQDTYSDCDSDEIKDTHYVLTQLKHSQHQLKF